MVHYFVEQNQKFCVLWTCENFLWEADRSLRTCGPVKNFLWEADRQFLWTGRFVNFEARLNINFCVATDWKFCGLTDF